MNTSFNGVARRPLAGLRPVTLWITLLSLAAASSALAQSAPKGAARRWEGALPVGPWSQVNLRTGRVLTTIPFRSWSGRGPSMGFALYHNQNSAWGSPGVIQGDLNEDEVVDEYDIEPFLELMQVEEPTEPQLKLADFNNDGLINLDDLDSLLEVITNPPTAPDWRHSYSAQLDIQQNGDVILTRDDGTQDTFVRHEEGQTVTYLSPPGVWDTLTADETGDGFTLTSKHQWKAHFLNVFGDSGNVRRLDWIADASVSQTGTPVNVLSLHYEDDSGLASYKKLKFVKDATYNHQTESGRKLILLYDGLGRLQTCRYFHIHLREMSFNYMGSSNVLASVKDTMNFHISFTYNDAHDIETISDRHEQDEFGVPIDPIIYIFDYWLGRLYRVEEPEVCLPNSSCTNYVQEIMYFGFPSSETQVTQYIDRRGKSWELTFDDATTNLVSVEDPLQHIQQMDFDDSEYALIHEPITYIDALEKEWSFTWDDRGNLTDTVDPLGHHRQYEFDSLNNLVRVSPPLNDEGGLNEDKQVLLEYEAALHPTSPTKIIEPAADTNDTESETIITYFGVEAINGYGHVNRITPPCTSQPVVTEMEYDEYGQPLNLREGPPSESQLIMPYPRAVQISYGFDDIGDAKDPSCDGTICGRIEPYLDGKPKNKDCYAASSFTSPDPPPCFPGSGGIGYGGTNDICILHLPQYEQDDAPMAETGCTSGDMIYTTTRNLTQFPKCAKDPITNAETTRIFDMQYDALNRLRSTAVTTNEATATSQVGPIFARVTNYDPDWSTGTYRRVGPDGTETIVQLDDAGRVATFVRRLGETELLTAAVDYDAADRPTLVTYSTGANTAYEYDDAGRPTRILHQVYQSIVHDMQYHWTADGLVDYIVENDHPQSPNLIDFTYDNRNRLIEEQRTGAHPYHLAYTYDKAGNRLAKTDVLGDVTTEYHYDVEDPAFYGSQGNRLVYSQTFVNGEPPTLLETRYYLYDRAGRVTYVVVEPPDAEPVFTGYQLFYNTQGLIYLAWSLRWQLDENDEVDANTVEYIAAMEYRYDEPRARYRTQRRDPRAKIPNGSGGMIANPKFFFPLNDDPAEGSWYDYDGDSIMSDFGLTITGQMPNATVTPFDLTAHEPGLGRADISSGPEGPFAVDYAMSNLIGTTETMTNGSNEVVGRRVYTAFGELVSSSFAPYAAGRYGYAGAWGYQEGQHGDVNGNPDPLAELGWLHVGARYYDPAAGRFMQRDPIGIYGGLNTYLHVNNNPVLGTDPSGLGWLDDLIDIVIPPVSGDEAVHRIMMTTVRKPSSPQPRIQHPVDRVLIPCFIAPLWLFAECERASELAALSVMGLPGAMIGDTVTTLAGVPLYDPNYRIGDCTRAVIRGIKDIWHHH